MPSAAKRHRAAFEVEMQFNCPGRYLTEGGRFNIATAHLDYSATLSRLTQGKLLPVAMSGLSQKRMFNQCLSSPKQLFHLPPIGLSARWRCPGG
jgi:hypothetical protein